MAFKLKTITVTVAAAGTQVRVVTDASATAERYVPWAYFEADAGNSGVCYLGDADVASTEYAVKLDASSASPGVNIPAPQDPRQPELNRLDLYETWVDAATNGDKVFVTYPVVS